MRYRADRPPGSRARGRRQPDGMQSRVFPAGTRERRSPQAPAPAPGKPRTTLSDDGLRAPRLGMPPPPPAGPASPALPAYPAYPATPCVPWIEVYGEGVTDQVTGAKSPEIYN